MSGNDTEFSLDSENISTNPVIELYNIQYLLLKNFHIMGFNFNEAQTIFLFD